MIIITTLNTYSQSVDIITKSDIKNLTEGKNFAFVEPATDTNFLQFVATIRAKDKNKKSVIENLYFGIRKQANSLGATCFKLKSFTRSDSGNEVILILDCYFAYEATLTTNTDNHEKNSVFIFGGEREDDKTISATVNGDTKEIKPGTYFKYILKEREELKFSKGGFTGAAIWLNWEKDKQPQFYSLSGFALNDINHQPANGIAFNTGRINRISNINLGLLLTKLLKQGN